MLKIDAVLRQAFARQEEVAKSLKAEVDNFFRRGKRDGWHFESRVKGIESFALKVETGRVASIEEVEDVFGATLVVPSSSQVEDAVELVLGQYDLVSRRPPTPASTHKRPESFPFDDVRLYVRYRRSEGEATSIPDKALFEVQIKTFLQHAWAVATHDVIYKTAVRDWRRERIAYQVRAALEAAEVAIGDVDLLAQSRALPESSAEIEEVNGIIALIRENWQEELLPRDVRRLAENIRELMSVVVRFEPGKDRVAILAELLGRGKARNGGEHSVDWSPYRSVLEYVAHDHKSKLRGELQQPWRQKKNQMLLIYPETLMSLGLAPDKAIGAVVAQ